MYDGITETDHLIAGLFSVRMPNVKLDNSPIRTV